MSPDEYAAERVGGEPPRVTLPAVRVVAVALGVLLLGYMFLGRGFAHVGLPPLYIGEVVLAICIVATGYAFRRNGVRVPASRILWLLLGLMALGAIRTVPDIGQYGFDALRDATLWGYAVFAVMVFVLADRDLVLRAFRLYGWVVPVFALWLPISYSLFSRLSGDIDPNAQGTSVPLFFFKGGDMAVHMVGAIASLVLSAAAVRSSLSILMSVIIGLPLVWTALVAGAANRGGLLTLILGLAAVVILAPRSRNWIPLLLATALLAVGLTIQGAVDDSGAPAPGATASPAPTGVGRPGAPPTHEPDSSPSGRPGASPSSSSDATAAPAGPAPTESTRATSTPVAATPTPDPSGVLRVQVENPSFELGPSDGSLEGWRPYGVGTYRVIAEGGHAGPRFAEVDNTGGAYQATLTSSRFAFTTGPDIDVSLWAKAIRGRPIVEIYVNWYDGTGDRISSDFLQGLATEGERDWQQVWGAFTAPADTATAEILLWEANGNAAIGIDDVTAKAGEFTPEPPPPPIPEGRPATLQQLVDNILSVLGSSSDAGLEGTKQFRLAWWGTIVDYTVFGDYFWTGKGFGVNLADVDGFQSTPDHSLRAPHNSHMTVLARMGVPGFALWLVLQAAFGIGLLRTILANRRAGDLALAAVGGWLLAYWVAMMLDTSFDPYLEGPQGGIWFWTVFGLGLVVMRLTPRRRTT